MFSIMIGIMAVAILLIVIYFIQPYSPLKSDFQQTSAWMIAETQSETGVFSQADIAELPPPVQKCFFRCGYLGTPKMSWMKTVFEKDIPFSTGLNKNTLKIDYMQYNLVKIPNRIAFIDSSIYGVPFQGFDSFLQGSGSMRGVIAKTFTLLFF
ncbi:hypothetical protein Sgly_1979 [Syntrophobotulus glycolicus DSM 8271]|uniref:Uncharacterized protein n=1 Tax=Syntrophobotulus glycolicus (strain DSM 8271 / FlGlyR) TaxID=645991 RepID=F0T1D3_SYNGF|nr:DUF6544 family protein [Syntrophobotulus glycolicus]ADY56274.1 hypothetical protein Sgly_1979 [Syntrophobotulus glycolicus DSM 8271]